MRHFSAYSKIEKLQKTKVILVFYTKKFIRTIMSYSWQTFAMGHCYLYFVFIKNLELLIEKIVNYDETVR